MPLSTTPIVARGTAAEIGLGLGRANGAAARAHLHRWKQALHSHDRTADELIATFIGASRFRAAVERYTPWLASEVDAVGAAADLSPDDTWFLQLMDESWQQRGLFRPEHCTSFGVLDGHRSWLGQTMDLEPFRHGAQVVYDIAPIDQPRQLIVSMAGAIGLFGVSAARFGICVNALSQVPTSPEGLPVAFVIRGALAQPDAAAAEAFIRSMPHATGQHYLITGERSVVSLECSAAGVVESMVGERKRWHTNHPLVGYVPDDDDRDSEVRGDIARDTLARTGMGRPRSIELLSTPGIWKPLSAADHQFTFAAGIVELRDSADPALIVAFPDDDGEADDLQWHEYRVPRQ